MTKIIFVFPRDSEVVDRPDMDALTVIADDGEEEAGLGYGFLLEHVHPIKGLQKWRRRDEEQARKEREIHSQPSILCGTCKNFKPHPGSMIKWLPGKLYCSECGRLQSPVEDDDVGATTP